MLRKLQLLVTSTLLMRKERFHYPFLHELNTQVKQAGLTVQATFHFFFLGDGNGPYQLYR